MTIKQTIIIALPASEVFKYRSCLCNTPRWQREVIEVELLTPDSTGLGARAIEHRRGAQGTIEDWELEITEYEPDAVLRIVSRYGPMLVDERHTFVQADDTYYTIAIDVTGAPFPLSVFQKKAVEGLVRLKGRLEDRADTPPS